MSLLEYANQVFNILCNHKNVSIVEWKYKNATVEQSRFSVRLTKGNNGKIYEILDGIESNYQTMFWMLFRTN